MSEKEKFMKWWEWMFNYPWTGNSSLEKIAWKSWEARSKKEGEI